MGNKTNEHKFYQLYGINTAMHLLRPNAKWEISNSSISHWDDPRPCPTWEEIVDTMEKIKKFEESIDTIWLPEQVEEFSKYKQTIEQALEQS